MLFFLKKSIIKTKIVILLNKFRKDKFCGQRYFWVKTFCGQRYFIL